MSPGALPPSIGVSVTNRSLHLRRVGSETDQKLPEPANDRQGDPDARLIEEVADGNVQAAAELINRHADRIFAIGMRMLGDQSAAEDLVQDVFFKIWKNAAKWEPGRAKFSTWLHRVAINLCYDRMRKHREASLEDMTDDVKDQPGQEPDGQEALEQQETADRVRKAVASLPERQAAAIALSHFEGYTNGETADILETTVEAVESLLARGRKSLRKILEGDREALIGGKE